MNWKQEIAGVINGNFKRNIFVDIKDKETIKETFNRMNNTDCYRSIYAYSNTDNIEDSLIYGPLVFDLDMNFKVLSDYDRLVEDLNILIKLLHNKLGLENNQYSIFFSGNKGFHIVIPPRVLGIKPMKNLNKYYKDLAMIFKEEMKHDTLDLSIYDKRRVLRENNTINSKSMRYKIETTIEEVNSISPKEIGRLSQNKRYLKLKKNVKLSKKAYVFLGEIIKENITPKKKNVVNKKNNNTNINFKITPCVRDLIENNDIKGERNMRSVALSSVLLQRGFSEEQVYEYMEAWNENLEEPLHHTELQSTIKSALCMFDEGKKYGCSSLSNFHCDKSCPLYKIR